MVTIRRATRDDVPAICALYDDLERAAHRDGDEDGSSREEPSNKTRQREPPGERTRTMSEAKSSSFEAFDDIDARPNDTLYVADIGGRVVGTFQLTILRYLTYAGARVGLIEAVEVAEGERNKGIGSQMMRFAIDEARRQKCNRVQLTSNKRRKDAHRFYERLGFVATHEGLKLFL